MWANTFKKLEKEHSDLKLVIRRPNIWFGHMMLPNKRNPNMLLAAYQRHVNSHNFLRDK